MGLHSALPRSEPGTTTHVRDSNGFDQVFLAEYEGLVRLATAISGAPAVAEELVQDAFIAALPRWDTLDRPGAFLTRSVVNRAIDATRRRRRTPSIEFLAPHQASPDPEPADSQVWAALDRLPHHQRAAVVLRYYLDLPVGEIAAVVDRPLNTVKSDLRRALRALHRELVA